MSLQDRRWHQYAENGFTFHPDDLAWSAFFKMRIKKETVVFMTQLPAYTDLAVATTKQKLRELAEKATKADTVGSLLGVRFGSLVGVLSLYSSRLVFCPCARKPRRKRQATRKGCRSGKVHVCSTRLWLKTLTQRPRSMASPSVPRGSRPCTPAPSMMTRWTCVHG